MSLRVGIIGARQGRHGIGEHVARHLAQLGATIVAIAGTSEATVSQAVAALRERYGILAAAHVGAEALLARERLDAVAICSPERYHRRHLQLALEAGVHALCEKPLVFETGRDPVADAQPLISAFAAAGQVMMVNEQWPYTLPCFARLFGDDPPKATARERRVAVWLCPGVTGPDMIPNALPHVLSLMLALAPSDGEARGIQSTWLRPETELAVAFDYLHSRGALQVSAVFRHAPRQPRPAAIEIDGRLAHRIIEPPDYQMFLERSDGSARLALEDPLRLLLADFLNRCHKAQAPLPENPILLKSLRTLKAVDDHVRSQRP